MREQCGVLPTGQRGAAKGQPRVLHRGRGGQHEKTTADTLPGRALLHRRRQNRLPRWQVRSERRVVLGALLRELPDGVLLPRGVDEASAEGVPRGVLRGSGRAWQRGGVHDAVCEWVYVRCGVDEYIHGSGGV